MTESFSFLDELDGRLKFYETFSAHREDDRDGKINEETKKRQAETKCVRD